MRAIRFLWRAIKWQSLGLACWVCDYERRDAEIKRESAALTSRNKKAPALTGADPKQTVEV